MHVIVSGHEMFAMTNEIWKLAFILSKDKKELPTIIGRYDLQFQLFLVIVLYWEMKVVQISPIYRTYLYFPLWKFVRIPLEGQKLKELWLCNTSPTKSNNIGSLIWPNINFKGTYHITRSFQTAHRTCQSVIKKLDFQKSFKL